MVKRVMQGVVVQDKGDKTVSVQVERKVMHPILKKYIKKSKKFQAHDEKNLYKIGDEVYITECPPISKTKTFFVSGRKEAETAKVS